MGLPKEVGICKSYCWLEGHPRGLCRPAKSVELSVILTYSLLDWIQLDLEIVQIKVKYWVNAVGLAFRIKAVVV